MNEGMISSRYAQALLLTLQTDAAGEQAYADAKRMLEVYETSGHQINVALQSEIVPRAQKENFLRALFERFGPSLLPLANLMLTRHRATFPGLCECSSASTASQKGYGRRRSQRQSPC